MKYFKKKRALGWICVFTLCTLLLTVSSFALVPENRSSDGILGNGRASSSQDAGTVHGDTSRNRAGNSMGEAIGDTAHDLSRAAGDAAKDAGNAVGDAVSGIGDMIGDAADGVRGAMDHARSGAGGAEEDNDGIIGNSTDAVNPPADTGNTENNAASDDAGSVNWVWIVILVIAAAVILLLLLMPKKDQRH